MLFMDITVVIKNMDCLEIIDCVVAMEIIVITAINSVPALLS
jgi:hypothetical protein